LQINLVVRGQVWTLPQAYQIRAKNHGLVEAIRDLIQQAGDWEEWVQDRKLTLVESSIVEEPSHA